MRAGLVLTGAFLTGAFGAFVWFATWPALGALTVAAGVWAIERFRGERLTDLRDRVEAMSAEVASLKETTKDLDKLRERVNQAATAQRLRAGS